MDFMTQLLKWNGVDAILVIVIRFSKLAKMVPTKTITTFDSTKLFFDIWVIHHWILQFIIDYRNGQVYGGLLETLALTIDHICPTSVTSLFVLGWWF